MEQAEKKTLTQAELTEKRQKTRKSKTLSVIFQKDLIAFPGEVFVFPIFQDKYFHLIDTLPDEQIFAIVSNINGKYICWAAELLETQKNIDGRMVFAKCLSRLAPNVITRKDKPRYSISIQEATIQQLVDESLYEVQNEILCDLNSRGDKKLENELMAFSERCIRGLTSVEKRVLEERHAKWMKPSFFMLSIFKIQRNERLACFLTQDDGERLAILQSYFRFKRPNRKHIRYSQPGGFSWFYAGFVVIVVVMVIGKIRSWYLG